MKTIVILENNQSELQTGVHIANAQELGAKVILLSNEQPKSGSDITHIVVTNGEIHSALAQAGNMLGEEAVLVLDAALKISKDDMEKALAACEGQTAKLFNFKDEDGHMYAIEDCACDHIPNTLGYSELVALGMIIIPAGALGSIEEATTASEALCKLVVSELAASGSFQTRTADIQIDKENAQQVFSMNTAARASSLRFLIHSMNIEDLFPNHAWDKHQEESAAASYHTLAATFIKLEDFNSAIECLALSDRLEDSPRSLALKGLIALQKGETLTAVANMVSSLQEYERRKKESEGHYLSFIPRDLEKINTNLQSGLSALNKRENDTAANCFREAVFHFDSFYEDCGLLTVKQ